MIKGEWDSAASDVFASLTLRADLRSLLRFATLLQQWDQAFVDARNVRHKKARLFPVGLFCISIGRDGRIRTSYPLHPIKVTACPSPSNRIYKPLNISKLVKNTSLHCPTTSTRIHRKRLRNGDGTVTRFRSIHGHHHR